MNDGLVINLWKTLGNSLITANINKYDNVLDMFAMNTVILMLKVLSNNIGDTMEDAYKIDLQQFSPLLPNRILLISKEDIRICFHQYMKNKYNWTQVAQVYCQEFGIDYPRMEEYLKGIYTQIYQLKSMKMT